MYILWVLIVATTIVTPEAAVKPECIPNWSNCLHTITPCCHQQSLERGQVLPHDFICWRFGSGLCTPLHKIPNLEKYAQLIKDVNSTNFATRYLSYWKDLGKNGSETPMLEDRIQGLRECEKEADATVETSYTFDVFFIFLAVVIFSVFSICSIIHSMTTVGFRFFPDAFVNSWYYFH
uniref:A'Hv0.8 cys-motif protein n=1 Tax=Campoletis sonorensis ichnovirus TaxID=10484 RepID=Q80KH8_CSIV|nr:A'Hv0.8 cys-motif protein precursor [Ichnoviriform sonorense]